MFTFLCGVYKACYAYTNPAWWYFFNSDMKIVLMVNELKAMFEICFAAINKSKYPLAR